MTDVSTLVDQAPTDQQIEEIRKAGRQQVALRKEVQEIFTTIAGLEWGSGRSAVRGSSFSPETRWAFAQFCYLTGANPYYHVDILGGGPYLNAEYWSDRINSDPLFHHMEQRDLSPSTEAALRERAGRLKAVAGQLPEGEERAKRMLQAFDLEEEADDVALARSNWSAPEWAQVVVETTIYRFMNAAPIDAIRSGEITDYERYLIAVPECNWAGGRPPAKKRDGSGTYDSDPIGNEEPAKTARTRSLRRAAARALPVMRTLEAQIRKAEKVLEGEWDIIQEDNRQERAALPSGDEPQAARSGGEATAASSEGAEPVPVRDVEEEHSEATAADDELQAARQRARDKFDVGCQAAAVDPAAVIAAVLDGRQPENLEDYTRLNAHVSGLVDAEVAQDEAGEGRVL